MASPFLPLLQGKDSEWVLAQNDFFIAALEKQPLVLGHVIVVAKREVDDVFDLENEALSSLLVFAKPIAKAIQKAVPCVKIGIAVLGLQTRHAHLHLVPIQTASDLDFTRAKLTPDPALLIAVMTQIRAGLKQ